MRRADFRRREEAFRDPVAKAFKVGSNNVEVSEPKVSAHVLEEAPGWLNLSDDAGDVGPEVPGVVGSPSFTGDAERLARVAASDSIHEATPRLAIEGSHVRPDRSLRNRARFHVRGQDRGCTEFPFHPADSGGSGHGALDAEFKPTGSRAERQDAGR